MVDKRAKKTSLHIQLNKYIKTQAPDNLKVNFKLQFAWENIASERELKHCDNIVRDPNKNAIIVFLDDSHWAAELSTKKELYRLMMENELNEEISEIKFLVTRKTALKKIFQKNRKKNDCKNNTTKTVKLSKEEERYAHKMVEDIKNKELQTALYNAIKTDLESKKGRGALKMPQNTPESPESI